MKKQVLNPGIWTLALVLIILTGARNQANAQEKKEINKTIVIQNGDTIINGKNLKNVSRAERKKLLKEMDELHGKQQIEINTTAKGDGDMRVVIRKKKDGEPEEVIVKNLNGPRTMVFKDGDLKALAPEAMPQHFKIEMDTLMLKMEGDSAFKQLRIRMKDLDSTMQRHFQNFEGGNDFEFFVTPEAPGAPHAPMPPRARMMGRDGAFGNEKNAQSFSYSSVDKDGIASRLNIRISEVNKEVLGKITGAEKAKTDLEVQDLNLFPSFSANKLNLSFSLKTKGATEIKLLDTDLKPVFTEKVTSFNETYYKSITFPKNGVYYLTVLQNGAWFVKKLIKE